MVKNTVHFNIELLFLLQHAVVKITHSLSRLNFLCSGQIINCRFKGTAQFQLGKDLDSNVCRL